MNPKSLAGFTAVLFLLFTAAISPLYAAESSCVQCHETISPGQVADWRASKHQGEAIGCEECHGMEHATREDAQLAVLPDERLCAESHEEQFEQFTRGKHNLG